MSNEDGFSTPFDDEVPVRGDGVDLYWQVEERVGIGWQGDDKENRGI